MAKSLPSKHPHPRPLLDRLVQYGAIALILVMLVTIPLQVLLTLAGAPGGLFLLTGIATLFLILPVLLLTTATPAVTVDASGLHIEPVIWKARLIPWEAIQTMKNYPLLPAESAEVTRRALVGSKKYQPAAGKMLVIPSLPVQYRVTGFFAGEGLTPVIALTNRSHSDYAKLIKKVTVYLNDAGVEIEG